MAKPKTVDEYIKGFPKDQQERLREIRECITSVIPNASEELKWGNPVYSDGTILVAFAGFKDHINFYPTPSVIQTFKEELSSFTTGGMSVQLPYDKPIPTALIKELTNYRVKEYEEKGVKWM